MSVGFHYGNVRFSKYLREEQIGMLDVELKWAYVDNVVWHRLGHQKSEKTAHLAGPRPTKDLMRALRTFIWQAKS